MQCWTASRTQWVRRTCRAAPLIPRAAAQAQAPAVATGPDRSHATDVVVIGSGIGGLSCAAMLSSAYGRDVTVLESHAIPGGETLRLAAGQLTSRRLDLLEASCACWQVLRMLGCRTGIISSRVHPCTLAWRLGAGLRTR